MAGPPPGHGGVTGPRPYPDAARNWPAVLGRTRGRVIGRRYRIPAVLGERNQGNLLSVLVKIRSLGACWAYGQDTWL
jgi:hypothetical protein